MTLTILKDNRMTIQQAAKRTALLLFLFAVLVATAKRSGATPIVFRRDITTAENAAIVLSRLRKITKNDVYKYVVPTI